MAVGFDTSKAGLNARMGQLVVNLTGAFEEVERVAMWAGRLTDEEMLARVAGMTQGDVTEVRAVIADLENLRLTAFGQRAQPEASNFFFNAILARAYN